MAKSRADEKVLSCNDVVLRRSDLDILSGPYFLNDRIIEFFLSHLSSCYPSEDILLVPPSIAFWIKECPDPTSLKDFLEPLQLPRRELILFPINDNDDVSMVEGGTHWSLLAFVREANTFVHHDSSFGNMNSSHSKRIYKAVLPYAATSNTRFLECTNTPKQANGYDCGLYVTAIARAICEWQESGKERSMTNLWFANLGQITPSSVSRMRKEILEIIMSLMEKQGK